MTLHHTYKIPWQIKRKTAKEKNLFVLAPLMAHFSALWTRGPAISFCTGLRILCHWPCQHEPDLLGLLAMAYFLLLHFPFQLPFLVFSGALSPAILVKTCPKIPEAYESFLIKTSVDSVSRTLKDAGAKSQTIWSLPSTPNGFEFLILVASPSCRLATCTDICSQGLPMLFFCLGLAMRSSICSYSVLIPIPDS